MCVDIIPACVRQEARFFLDDKTIETFVNWQWCRDDALPLPIPTRFGSTVYLRYQMADYGELGMVFGAPFTFIDGDKFHKPPGKCYLGTAEQWLHGIKTTDPYVDLPDCCRSSLYTYKASGGINTSGGSDTHVHRKIASTGGLGLSSTAPSSLGIRSSPGGPQGGLGGSATVQVTYGSPATETDFYADEEMPVSIPDDDLNGVNLEFNVQGVNPAWRLLEIGLDIAHPFIGDLVIRLTSPTGLNLELLSRIPQGTGTSPGTRLDININDAYPIEIKNAVPNGALAIIGNFRPDELLTQFGINVNGIWRLNIADVLGGNIGRINIANLRFALVNQFMVNAFGLLGVVGIGQRLLRLNGNSSGGLRLTNSASATFTPSASLPPCSHANVYQVIMSGATGTPSSPNGTYTLVWTSTANQQEWDGFVGTFDGILRLDNHPAELTFLSFSPFCFAVYDCVGNFDCNTGGTFNYTSQNGSGTYPASVTVTKV